MKFNLIHNLWSQVGKKKENAAKLGIAVVASTILTAGICMPLYLFGITILGTVGSAAILTLIYYESQRKIDGDKPVTYLIRARHC